MEKTMKSALTLAVVVLSAASAAAGPYRTMARELAKAGLKHDVRRVAVLPFSPIDGSSSLEGEGVAEHLVTELVRSGKLEVVERGLLAKVMKEHALMATGAIRRDQVSKVGEMWGADAIVTGSFSISGGKVLLHTRMIEVGSGRALYASTARLDAEWAWDVRVPALEVPAPVLLRDAVAGVTEPPMDCEEAAATIEVVWRTTLGLRARYQAANPGPDAGSEIADPELRARFYLLVRSASYRDAPRLDRSELTRLAQAEEKVHRLAKACL